MIKKNRYLSRIFMGVLTLGDMAFVAFSYWIAYALRFRTHFLGLFTAESANPIAYWYSGPVVLFVFWLVFKYLGLYKSRRGISSVDEFRRLLNGTIFSVLVLTALTFFVREFHFSIKVVLVASALVLISLLLWRTLLRWAQIRARRRGLGVVRTVVVGSGVMARKLIERTKANPGMGYRLVGLVDDGRAGKKASRDYGVPWLGGIKGLKAAVAKHHVECVIVALPAGMHHKTHQILLDFDSHDVELRIVSDLYGFITSPLAVDEIHGIPVFAIKEAPLDRTGNRVLKRIFDLVLVIPGLILISPLMMFVAAVIKLDSHGPIFYTQERVGRDNKPFKMIKFRSMRVDAEVAGPGWTTANDPRRTRSGGFLRKSSIDELPQLFNILIGNMSLVGPRPERPHYVEQFKKSIPRYLQRHQVKAGLTGWAQVHGWRGDTSIEERTAFDLYYVENWSLSLDLLILVKTILEIFEHETAY